MRQSRGVDVSKRGNGMVWNLLFNPEEEVLNNKEGVELTDCKKVSDVQGHSDEPDAMMWLARLMHQK